MIIILLLIFTNLASSDEYFRVFYKEKDTLNFVQGNSYYEETLKLFNERAIKRRNLHQKNITIEDAIINPEYISILQSYDLDIVSSSRWFNYTLIKANEDVISELEKNDFIKNITRTTTKFKSQSLFEINYTEEILDKNRYGRSLPHSNMLNVDFFHSMGFNGDSVVVGYLDTGYKLNPEIFDSTQLHAQYDFVYNDNETANQEIDPKFQDFHGTAVLSTVSAYYQDSLIGIASESKYILSKTEDIRSETNIEEDFYLFGVEWMESQGAEILNSSLGYVSFDSLQFSYNYNNLDGNTTLVSQSVNKAVDKGILFFTSMGNNGGSEKTLTSPSDADSVIAIGALASDGITLAGFSSKGPNAKGDIRPHLMAHGLNVTIATTDTTTFFGRNSGTSFSSPIMAGCGAIVKAIYDIPSYQIKNAMITTANNYENPSNTFGYGKINMQTVVDTLSKTYGPAISPYNVFQNGDYMRVVFYVYSPYDDFKVFLKYKSSEKGLETEVEMDYGIENYQFYADIPKSSFTDDEVFMNLEVRYNLINKFYSEDFVKFSFGNEIIRKGVDKFSMPTLVNNFQKDINIYIADNELIIENNLKKVEDFEINILDITGKSLFLYSILLRNGKNVLNIQRNLNTGLYLITLRSKSNFITRKIILTNSGS